MRGTDFGASFSSQSFAGMESRASIGRAIALRFAGAGADVALNYLDDRAAAESAAPSAWSCLALTQA